MAVQTKIRQGVEQFWAFVAQPENAEKRWELIAGEIIEMPPSSPTNSILAVRIARLLGNFVEPHGLGWVSGADSGYKLAVDMLFQPDAAFISKARAPKLPERFFEGAPDLAVEIISPSERHTEIRAKISAYLAHGGRLVWIVYPDQQIVDVWQAQPDGALRVESFDKGQTLRAGDLLPEFSLPIAALFDGLD
jgi:Uma2 family endonuclease